MNYSIRKAIPSDARGIAKVHVDSWKTTYPGLIPRATIKSQTYKKKVKSWTSKLVENELNHNNQVSQTYVSIVDEDFNENITKGQIIGFIHGGKTLSSESIYDAEIYAFYLLQAVQRNGIGTALLNCLMTFLVSRNYSQAIVWVVKNNPAEKFYQNMGGVIKEAKIDQMGKKPITEIGYVFNLANQNQNNSP